MDIKDSQIPGKISVCYSHYYNCHFPHDIRTIQNTLMLSNNSTQIQNPSGLFAKLLPVHFVYQRKKISNPAEWCMKNNLPYSIKSQNANNCRGHGQHEDEHSETSQRQLYNKHIS